MRKIKGKERKSKRKEAKRVGEEWRMQWLDVLHFRESVSSFSLGLWLIRPSDSFETRRGVVLQGEDNVWTPVLGSFFKLLEVGVSSYLFYTLFKCFVMFVFD